MITKEQIKDWLQIKVRQKSEVEIEKYIDKQLKENLMNGVTSFNIVTHKTKPGHYGMLYSTEFNEIWNNPELSEDNKKKAQMNVIEKYRKNGFPIDSFQLTGEYTGEYDKVYHCVSFDRIEKMLEED